MKVVEENETLYKILLTEYLRFKKGSLGLFVLRERWSEEVYSLSGMVLALFLLFDQAVLLRRLLDSLVCPAV